MLFVCCDFVEIMVLLGCYFLFGDNCDNSEDLCFIGIVVCE